MKPRRQAPAVTIGEGREGPPLLRPRRLGATLLQAAATHGFGVWMLLGLSLAIGMYPAGRGDALVPLMIGGALVGVGLLAACVRSPWMPDWHGWRFGKGSRPTRDALVALATVLPVLAVAGLARGDNSFWVTRLAGAALALCSLVSLIVTVLGDASRNAPGLDKHVVTQLPLSRVVSATYGGGLWLWMCMMGQDNPDALIPPLVCIIGLLLLALLRGLIESLRWQAVLQRLPGPRPRFELQPRRYLGALLIYAVPSMALLMVSFGEVRLEMSALAAISCLIGMGTELSLYDGALAALPDSR
ncbi:hypothetical protein [Dyella sp. C9]|uniref:hypothetical protein n=1 Tax=Dyella sp. C9 TaxID=2202154 RepID=UPI000DEF9DD9|nr:hypothetical protein [Dyella sp. C9]